MDYIMIPKDDVPAFFEEAAACVLAVAHHRAPELKAGKKWLTNPEGMEFLGLSRPTLQRYRASGKLPYSKVGGNIYYKLADLEALLEAHMQSR